MHRQYIYIFFPLGIYLLLPCSLKFAAFLILGHFQTFCLSSQRVLKVQPVTISSI